MDNQEIEQLYNRLFQLVNEGKEKEAEAHFKEQFPKLPREVQGQILLRLATAEMNNEADRLEATADFQEQGIAFIEAMEALKPKQ